jgi:hypothetical protein
MALALAAVLLVSACSSSSVGPCAAPPQPASVPPDVACRIAQECLDRGTPCTSSSACKQACPAPMDICALPPDYVAAYQSANAADAGGTPDGGTSCPSTAATVTVQCTPYCM